MIGRNRAGVHVMPTWDVTARRTVLVVAYRGGLAQHRTTFAGAHYVLDGYLRSPRGYTPKARRRHTPETRPMRGLR